jgi:hypothetical protein
LGSNPNILTINVHKNDIEEALYTLDFKSDGGRERTNLWDSSSNVEQTAEDGRVAGSNPAFPTIFCP